VPTDEGGQLEVFGGRGKYALECTLPGALQRYYYPGK
jgi:hypothetical protein